jgi:translation initiation factor IF-3
MFRGREVVHRDIGYRIIEEVIQRVGDRAVVEKSAGIDGRDMHAILAPKINEAAKVPKKPKTPKPAATPVVDSTTTQAPAPEVPIQ